MRDVDFSLVPYITRRDGGCYFVQRKSDGLIKIGHAGAVRERFSGLCRENGALLVLAILERPADRDFHWLWSDDILEAAAHLRFLDLQVDGEWFKPDPALLDFAALVRKSPRTALRRLITKKIQTRISGVGRYDFVRDVRALRLSRRSA